MKELTGAAGSHMEGLNEVKERNSMAFIKSLAGIVFDTGKLSEFHPIDGKPLYRAWDADGTARVFAAKDVEALLVRGSKARRSRSTETDRS